MLFEDFFYIALIPIILCMLIANYVLRKRHGSVRISAIHNLKKLAPSKSLYIRHLLIVLRILAVTLLIIAIMRPQRGVKETKIHSDGVDIQLVIDISTSMRAEDFSFRGKSVNRLEAVKNVVKEFIKKRPDDRIGLVVFAGNAYTQCPLTLDHGVLLDFLERVHIGMIEDGTAIGEGIATALNRLKDVESKSKIMILLTDGVNNKGRISPEEAANLAKAIGVKIYAIGAGSKGNVPYPAQDIFGNKVYKYVRMIELDDAMLTKVSRLTNGKYYRATDTNELKKIYQEIDKLEKSKVEITAYHEYFELFHPLLLMSMLVLIIEILLANTRLRTIP